jgi:hypothetical protein
MSNDPKPWQGFTFPGGQAASKAVSPKSFTIFLDFNEPQPDEPGLIVSNREGKRAYLDREQARTLANSILLWLDEENKKDETHG